jgi:hypothetical protein
MGRNRNFKECLGRSSARLEEAEKMLREIRSKAEMFPHNNKDIGNEGQPAAASRAFFIPTFSTKKLRDCFV